MAKRPLRTRSQFTTTINADLLNDLRLLSDKTGIPISKLLDRAVEMLLNDMRNNKHLFED